ncbi:hypothetical protein GCM10009677_14760 [Sphaerisporangium rubeum]|uniref:Uncharacterized protein n=1 Tax=Sphaerisporangium rubeum TaxID=321317 RepID=A0A7X0M6S2_9ACTN|nr:hypothetical protein [Sphaerisporangium rubeum]MBB6472146.1 hypothetical protein [Sphaerisporangium rubeum]
MPKHDTSPPSPPVRPGDLRQATAWLNHHGLDTTPTPLLAARLAVRRRARIAFHITLAAMIIAASLARVQDLLARAFLGRTEPDLPLSLLGLTVSVAALLVVQALIFRWVRRADRRAGALLSRRVAHTLQPGWRAVLGLPHAAFTAATLAAAFLLATSALTVDDTTVRHAALILMVGLAGVAASLALQLRDLLAGPVVAEDEASLTADVVMRVEDARDLTAPTVPWTLPVVLLFGTAPLWWNVASMALILIGVAVAHIVATRTPSTVTVARQAMSTR